VRCETERYQENLTRIAVGETETVRMRKSETGAVDYFGLEMFRQRVEDGGWRRGKAREQDRDRKEKRK